nr:helix-turn-helix domain-containing protein [Qipengyuania aestuarii]
MAEVAEVLKMPEEVIVSMAADGELPAFTVRDQWRIRRSDFDSWLGEMASEENRQQSRGKTSSRSAGSKGEKAMADGSSEPAVSRLTVRASQVEMHTRLIEVLGKRVLHHGPVDAKPLEIDLGGSLPVRIRVYMYNATRPPGGRPLGEHKVQLIVPGQGRAERGSFDHGDDRVVLLIGYAAEEDVFILWDAGLYSNFAWSRNVQVKAETIIEATAGKLATQFRQLRPGNGPAVVETLIATPAERLAEAVDTRIQLTRQRLIEG